MDFVDIWQDIENMFSILKRVTFVDMTKIVGVMPVAYHPPVHTRRPREVYTHISDQLLAGKPFEEIDFSELLHCNVNKKEMTEEELNVTRDMHSRLHDSISAAVRYRPEILESEMAKKIFIYLFAAFNHLTDATHANMPDLPNFGSFDDTRSDTPMNDVLIDVCRRMAANRRRAQRRGGSTSSQSSDDESISSHSSDDESTSSQSRDGGCTSSQSRDGGCTSSQSRDGGFISSQSRDGGSTSYQTRDGGSTLSHSPDPEQFIAQVDRENRTPVRLAPESLIPVVQQEVETNGVVSASSKSQEEFVRPNQWKSQFTGRNPNVAKGKKKNMETKEKKVRLNEVTSFHMKLRSSTKKQSKISSRVKKFDLSSSKN